MPTKFNPAGHRVVVKLAKLEEQHEGFIPESLKNAGFKIKAAVDEEELVKVACDQGFIVAIGPNAWKHPDLGGEPWAKIGDEVVFGRYAGKIFRNPDDEEDYMVLNDEDIQMVIERS